jgi:NTE family protein
VLQKNRVPVDCVAGTSMGALVAGVGGRHVAGGHARGAGAVDWGDMFIDNPEYAELSQRNKLMARATCPVRKAA